jgi:tRNA threonylcarbamoyladenosine biosynthesis protein TsaE
VTGEFITHSEEDTSAVGEQLAQSLRSGDVVLLYGELGAGKTAFVRGMARGLGAAADVVTSPTFTLIQEYAGRVTLYHVDLYRLEPQEIPDLGLEDLVLGDGVVAIEWADRWPGRPDDVIEVTIGHVGEEERRVSITRGEPLQGRLLDHSS